MNVDVKVLDTLKDLVRINKDRTDCYEKAADEIYDPFEAEIKTVFYQMADESRRYGNVLATTFESLHGAPLMDRETSSGEIYKAWLEMKVSFSGRDVLTSLQSCECSDDAVLKAYKMAINMKAEWPTSVANLLSNQYKSLKASHDRVRRYRDEFVEKLKFA
jgi:uncharacterized protein (TIGR02284 family)